MLHLIFARHGQSTANLEQIFSNRGWKHPLTPLGERQAAALAEHLRPMRLTRIYSSPLMRAVQTSEIIAAALGLNYLVHDALREYDVGVYEDSCSAEGWRLYDQVDSAWLDDTRAEDHMPGGENLVQIRARFLPFIASLTRRFANSDECILLLGHGGLYRLMLPEVVTDFSRVYSRRYNLPQAGLVETEWRQPGGLWVVGGWSPAG